MMETSKPTDSITSTSNLDDNELIDRYPIGGIVTIFIVGGCFFCFCLFIIWRCCKFESKEKAKQLEAEYRKYHKKLNHSDDEESIEMSERNGLMNNINNDKWNRMKTKDELYETNKRESEIEKKK
eukprot:113792_1